MAEDQTHLLVAIVEGQKRIESKLDQLMELLADEGESAASVMDVSTLEGYSYLGRDRGEPL